MLHVDLPDTPYMDAVLEILRRIDGTIPENFRGTVTAYLLGGAAVHIHTGWRVSKDVDATFSHRILMPQSLSVRYDDDGIHRTVRFDNNFTAVIALLHPDWEKDAIPLGTVGRFALQVITPTDLAVSKVGRFAGNDADDIRELALAGRLDADAVKARCLEALDFYVGDTTMVMHNLADALDVIRAAVAMREQG